MQKSGIPLSMSLGGVAVCVPTPLTSLLSARIAPGPQLLDPAPSRRAFHPAGICSMSVPCASCPKSFADQTAANQHFQSVHNRAAYKASIKAAKKAKREKAKESIDLWGVLLSKQSAGIGVNEPILPPIIDPRLPIDETVLQQDLYLEALTMYNGPDSDDSDYDLVSPDTRLRGGASIVPLGPWDPRAIAGHTASSITTQSFTCNICGDRLPDANALTRHLGSAHIESQLVYRCHMCEPPCERTFSTQEALDAHIMPLIEPAPPETISHSKGRFLCDVCAPPCNNTFDTREALSAHLASIVGKPRFDIPDIRKDKEMQNLTTRFLRKIRTGHNDPSPSRSKIVFICNKCEPPCKELFETKEALSTHLRSMQQKAHFEIEALETNLSSMKEQSRTKIESLEMQMEVLEMELRFVRETSHLEIETMNTHLASMKERLRLDATYHSEALTSLACNICSPFCGNTFDGERTLQRHIDIVIENAINTRSVSIKERRRLDTADFSGTRFPLTCSTCIPSCGSILDTLESLRSHLELVIEKSHLVIISYSKYQFLCDICDPPCGYIFDTQEALKAHVKNMTGKFLCDTCNPSCGRTFSTKAALGNHLEFVGIKLQRNTARYSRNKWSPLVPETPGSTEKLRSMIHSKDVLAGRHENIKCLGCHRLLPVEDPVCNYHPGKWEKHESKNRPSCCKRRSLGCVLLNKHTSLNLKDPETIAKSLTFQETPPPSPGDPKRKAVALGYAVGISTKSTPELIQLGAVDYFTGEILIDMVVRPKNPVADYRSRYTGATKELAKRAVAEGEFLESSGSARAELLKWVDSQTIIIGHSLHHVFWLLQINHNVIIDSSVSVPKLQYKTSNLKVLCQKHLGETVQSGDDGHDCVGDSLAVRELVIWCTNNGAAAESRASNADKANKHKETWIRKQKKVKQAS